MIDPIATDPATTDRDAEKASRGKTLFLVDAKAEGVTARAIPKLGMRCVGSCEVFLDNVYVPATHVIGEAGYVTSFNARREEEGTSGEGGM